MKFILKKLKKVFIKPASLMWIVIVVVSILFFSNYTSLLSHNIGKSGFTVFRSSGNTIQQFSLNIKEELSNNQLIIDYSAYISYTNDVFSGELSLSDYYIYVFEKSRNDEELRYLKIALMDTQSSRSFKKTSDLFEIHFSGRKVFDMNHYYNYYYPIDRLSVLIEIPKKHKEIITNTPNILAEASFVDRKIEVDVDSEGNILINTSRSDPYIISVFIVFASSIIFMISSMYIEGIMNILQILIPINLGVLGLRQIIIPQGLNKSIYLDVLIIYIYTLSILIFTMRSMQILYNQRRKKNREKKLIEDLIMGQPSSNK